MIYSSHYWISATALEPINNHEIVVLEKSAGNKFTIRHAKMKMIGYIIYLHM